MTADPPVLEGADQMSVAVVLLGEMLGLPTVGAPGVVYGVTELLALDAVLLPALFTASTVNV